MEFGWMDVDDVISFNNIYFLSLSMRDDTRHLPSIPPPAISNRPTIKAVCQACAKHGPPFPILAK